MNTYRRCLGKLLSKNKELNNLSEYNGVDINLGRLVADLNELSKFGYDKKTGGIFRPAYSLAYKESVNWLISKMQDCGLSTSVDPVGNVIGRLGPRDLPAVICGSHIDSVPGGGKLDGTLGVLAGLEVARCILESSNQFEFALEIIAFVDEEGAYISLLGSRAMIGDLKKFEIDNCLGRDGQSLKLIMQQYGLDPDGFINAARPKEEIKAYIELHIEQGPVLEKCSIDIGVVEGIVGILTSEFNFSGQANHAGTTPVSLRQDALRAASETITKCFNQLEEDLNGDARLTFGKLDVFPGASNVVPSLSRGLQEIRAASNSDLDRIYNQTLEIANDTAHTHKVTFESKILSRDEPAKMAESITSIISSVCSANGYSHMLMKSGAGHDAQVMAKYCKSSLIFIPSCEGISHNAKEHSSERSLEIGTNALCKTIFELLHYEH